MNNVIQMDERLLISLCITQTL